ncbi:hypothetical protein CFC21_074404 [Triticum aestivum]|uniref:Uncharacterized protein n=3 Tax=Triticum TaxID=4564 RepID=A0A9R0XLA3_TRITD|nr:hypothetical protein CFC21_074404 [Triticum aestivum]VAI38922.1 unnamed protein product [Triticum turgidum subsp. durum]
MSGYLTALRESENMPQPPPLVQEYIQLAPGAVHLEDFLGYHATQEDSMTAPTVPVVPLDDSSSSNDSDDDDGLYDEMDFGGVEDE